MKIKKLSLIYIFLYTLYYFNSSITILANQEVTTTPHIEAPVAVLMDAETGIIIYDKNMHEIKYPASLTKLMTALMLLEHADNNFNQRVFMSRNAVFSIPRGSSHIAMNEDETLSVDEALYAIMLESANEVSNAIAEHVAGDLDTFADMMTKRAHELGAINTNFTNAHGLHHNDHYTTAYDMALIMQELVKYEKFLEVINTKTYTIPPTEKQPLERILNNSHRMIQPGNFYHEYTIGGKTGFTNEALHTLATYGKKDEVSLIAVVLENQRLVSYTDTKNLLDYGFTMFNNVEIFNTEDFAHDLSLVQNIDGETIEIASIPIVAESSITKNLPTNIDLNEIETEIDLPAYIYPPVTKDLVVGQLIFKYNDTIIDTVNLKSNVSFTETIPPTTNTNNRILGGLSSSHLIIKIVLSILISLFVLYVLLKIIRLRYKRRTLSLRRSFNNANGTIRCGRYRYK